MTTQNPVYASQAKPWLKYYAQKYIDQTLPTLRHSIMSAIGTRTI